MTKLLEALVAAFILALLCGGWYLVQSFVDRHDPIQPGVEKRCGCGLPKTPSPEGDRPPKC